MVEVLGGECDGDGIYGDDSRNTGAFGGLIIGHSDITEDNETCTETI